MSRLVLVFLGSGAGGVLRYALAGWINTRSAGGVPWGTLAVNALGSLLIAVVIELAVATRPLVGPDVRLALTTGVMGGFTTYSTFNHETLALFERGDVGLAATNLALTVVGCGVAGALGITLGRALAG